MKAKTAMRADEVDAALGYALALVAIVPRDWRTREMFRALEMLSLPRRR